MSTVGQNEQQHARRISKISVLVCVLAGIALWGLAAWARIRWVDHANTGIDGLGQFLAALGVTRGGVPRPPNPEGGHSLWLVAMPMVWTANSLRGLFVIRFVVAALIAPLTALATGLIATRLTRSKIAIAMAAGTSGVLVALDPGLIHTVVEGFPGYGAPEWIGFASLFSVCLYLAPVRWRPLWAGLTALALVIATGQHPMAFGVMGALAVLCFWCLRVREWKSLAWFGLVLGLAMVPRVIALLQLMQCGAPGGPWACLSNVALGSSHPEIAVPDRLWRAFHDRFAVDLGTIWLGFAATALVGVVPWGNQTLNKRQAPSAPLWIALSVGCALVGTVLLGTGISSLRSYHLRILAAPIAMMVGLGVVRFWPLGVGLMAWAWAAWQNPPIQGFHPNSVNKMDEIAAGMASWEGPLWVDGVWWKGGGRLEPAGVVLAAVLQGQSPERFGVGVDVGMVLLVGGDGESTTMRFDGPVHARQWVDQNEWGSPVGWGGAFDWWAVLHPNQADIGASSW